MDDLTKLIRRMTTQPVGEIGELLDRIYDEGYDYDRDKDWKALRTAVASLQDELDAEKRTCLGYMRRAWQDRHPPAWADE